MNLKIACSAFCSSKSHMFVQCKHIFHYLQNDTTFNHYITALKPVKYVSLDGLHCIVSCSEICCLVC